MKGSLPVVQQGDRPPSPSLLPLLPLLPPMTMRSRELFGQRFARQLERFHGFFAQQIIHSLYAYLFNRGPRRLQCLCFSKLVFVTLIIQPLFSCRIM